MEFSHAIILWVILTLIALGIVVFFEMSHKKEVCENFGGEFVLEDFSCFKDGKFYEVKGKFVGEAK